MPQDKDRTGERPPKFRLSGEVRAIGEELLGKGLLDQLQVEVEPKPSDFKVQALRTVSSVLLAFLVGIAGAVAYDLWVSPLLSAWQSSS